MSNNRSLSKIRIRFAAAPDFVGEFRFLCSPTTRWWSAAPSAEAGFYAFVRTGSISFLHFFVSFFFAVLDPVKGL